MENIFNNLQSFYTYRKLIPIKLDNSNLDTLSYDYFSKSLKNDGFTIQLVMLNDNVNKLDNVISIIIICEYDYTTKISDFKKLLSLLSKKVKKDTLLTYKSIIFISENGFSNAVTKGLNNILTDIYNDVNVNSNFLKNDKIENLKFDNFKAIIPLGQYCSKHRILDKKEVDELLSTTHVNKNNLPTILFSDPQIIWIGAKRGDIIEIDRVSESTGSSIYYRCVN
jgi:DNA-directed RNA polymerase subunit H (RpoH/RPB5)